jgi:predicted transglutaminase-like protease
LSENKKLTKIIKQRDDEIKKLKETIAELEESLYEYEDNDISFTLSDTEQSMLNIISEQIGRLAADSKVTRLDKDDVKLFDSYVKDLVAIRGKMPTPKTDKDKEGEESEAELIALLGE